MPRLSALLSLVNRSFARAAHHARPSGRPRFQALCTALAFAASGLALAGSTARADLADCGNIYVEANAECTVVPPSAQCQAMCTPISVRAVCSARLAAGCEASCNELPSVDCSGRCYAGCEGKCTIDPGKFDCEAACGADCSGRCAANCATHSDGTSCKAECMGACGVSCKKSCDIEAPSADCRARCEAGCEGSCKVETNIDCQLQCQAEGYAKCEADVQGGCKLRCESQNGALFCDGQYVDHGDNLQQCIDTLKAIQVRVEGESRGDAACDAGSCRAEGEASVTSDCSTTTPGARANLWALFALIAGLMAYLLRIRRVP